MVFQICLTMWMIYYTVLHHQNFTKLGLDNAKKLVAHFTSMVYLGILVDTESRTMFVSPEKYRILLICALNGKVKNPVQKGNGSHS